MSLTSCIKKAGAALRVEDKNAVVALARQYRTSGMTPDAAALKAIDEQIKVVAALLKTEASNDAVQTTNKAPPQSTPAPAAIEAVAPELASAGWDSLDIEKKTAALKRAGWVTAKGDLNVVGKQLIKKPWASITEGTRATISKNLTGKEVKASDTQAPAATETIAINNQQDPAVQRAEFAKAEKRRQDKAARLRGYTYAKSPFLAFLGKHGIAMSRKADFSPDKNPLLSGYGPLFRRTGKNTDLLVQDAIEEHFLPEGAEASDLDDLISQQINGMGAGQTKRIEAVYSPDVADRVMNERMADAQDAYAQELAAQQETAQNDGEDPFAPLSALQYTEMDAEIAQYNSADNAVQLEVNALLLTAEKLGIDSSEITEQAFYDNQSGTQQDYLEAARAALKSAIEGSNGNSRPDAGQPGPTASQEGLVAPSQQDVLVQQDRKNNAEALDQKEQIDREASGQTLTSQAAPEQRSDTSGDMFGAESDAAKRSELENLRAMFETANKDFANATPAMHRNEAARIEKAAATMDKQPDIKRRYKALAEMHRATADRKESGQGGMFDAPASVSKIADFGEKIGGARKDVWTAFTDQLGAVKDNDILSEPFSKIWPQPDYQALIDGGMSKDVAAFIHAARDEVPARPRTGYKVKRWAGQVQMLRDLATKLMDGSIDMAKTRTMMGDGTRNMAGFIGRMDLYSEVGHAKSLAGIRMQWHNYSLYKGEKNVSMWVVERDAAATAFSNFPQELATGKTKDEAIAKFKLRYDSLDSDKAKSKEVSFDIYSYSNQKGYLIGKKAGRNHIKLAGPFDSVKEAREYRQANQEALVKALEKAKEIPRERRDTNEPRVGEDMRNGQDVTPEMFGESFGFRGVEFGNWVEQGRRQKDLNDAFDALMDMAAVLGLPPKAISLNGELGLAFGARGSGGVSPAAATYESSKVVINLTKKSGAGSLGHEWWHAVDNYFSRMRSKPADMMTTALDVSLSSRDASYMVQGAVRKEMIDAFGQVVKAIKNTALKARSAKLDARRSKEYWTTGDEMAARSFESYLISKLQDQSASNDYLANIVAPETWRAAEALGFELDESYPYPTAGELPIIRDAFDRFFQTVQTKETDKGVAMFSRATDAAGPEQNALQAISQNDELFALPKSDSKTVEGITADDASGITVKKSRDAVGREVYDFTMPGGQTASLSVRAFNPYASEDAPTLFGYTLKDGEMTGLAIERPGTNPEEAGDLDDVWVDVSKLKEGGGGARIYNIAQTYAHNTGRIFIGDPAGLTDEALRRRTEQMLSSALKFGTTRHLAPHPRQVEGDAKLGITPLKWTYGDDLGNIRSLLETSLANYTDVNPLTFEPSTGQYLDSEGHELDRDAIRQIAKTGPGREIGAGSTTLERAAIFESLLREEGGESDSGRRRAGTLERLVELSSQFSASTAKAFYSRSTDPVAAAQSTQAVEKIVQGIKSRWVNAPDVIVVYDMTDPRIPAKVRATDLQQRSGGATGDPEGFFLGGKAYIVASQVSSQKDVARVLLHESLGHFGLRGVFGEQLKPILQQLAGLRRQEVAAKAKAYGLDMSNESQRLQAAEEVLAEMAQNTPDLGFVKRAIAIIRTWLRRNVPGFKNMALTDADIIQQFILPARRYVTDGIARNSSRSTRPSPSTDKPNFDQFIANGAWGDAKIFPDFSSSKTFVEKGFGGLDVPTQRVVLSQVIAAMQDLKIFNSVIDLLPINMVNVLTGKKTPTKVTLHDKAVLKNLLSFTIGDNTIPLTTDASTALIKATAYAVAKHGSISPKSASFPRNSLPAMSASNDRALTYPKGSLAFDSTEVVDRPSSFVSITGNTNAALSASYDSHNEIIQQARGWVERGQQADVRGMLPAFARGTNDAVTNSNDVVGNQGGRSADDSTPGVLFTDENENAIVFEREGFRISVNKPGAASYVVLWAKQVVNGKTYWRKAGTLDTNQKTKKIGGISGEYLGVSSIEIEKAYRNQGLGLEMYRALIAHAVPNISGVISHTPNRVNKQQVPSIYRKLGAFTDGDNQIIPIKPNKPTAPDSGGAPMFSRSLVDALNSTQDLKLPAGYIVNDFFKGDGKLNWWHRSVGTMYNLAQRSPAFKKVFDGTQDFINDVSHYATEAADLAPSILPKLDSMKDLLKSPMTAADNKAIAAPIFEGTLVWMRDGAGKPVKASVMEEAAAKMGVEEKAQRLFRENKMTEGLMKMWQGLPMDQYEKLIAGKYSREFLKPGIVFTPAELKSQFNLTDGQVALYQEFRAATDKSLTSMAVADMIRFGGEDVAAVRDQALAMGDVDAAAVLMRDHLLEQAEGSDRSDVLIDTANKMINKADRARDLMNRGYAPLSRFGSYSLDVVDDKGARVYFGLFESKAEANKMARQMRGNFPSATISQGTISDEEYKLFAGVSPETLEIFGEMLGLESGGDDASHQAFQQYLKLAKANRSAMKRLIERKGISGFSEDPGRVLAGFVYSNARQTSAGLHMGGITEAVRDIPKGQGELKDAAMQLFEYVKNPQEEAQQIRGLLFAQYLGGSIASAMINLTQPLNVTFPWLSQYGGAIKAAGQMKNAVVDGMRGATGDKALDAALKKAEEDGIVSPQEVFQLMAQAQGRATLKPGDGTATGDALAKGSNALSKLSLAWGKVFGLAEQFNRRTTFIAAYRTAIEQKLGDPAVFAEKAVNETQFIYNKGCVDAETECLTAAGWKSHADLEPGEVVYAVDARTGELVESKLLDVHRYPGQVEVTNFNNSYGFSMVLSDEHNCIVQNYNSRDKKFQRVMKVKAKDVKVGHNFLRVPLGDATGREAVYSDDEVRLFAWVAAEGCLFAHRNCVGKRGVNLSQSMLKNPEYVAEIDSILGALGGHYSRHVVKNGDMIHWSLRKPLWSKIHEALPGKMLTFDLVKKLTIPQMSIFLETFVKGDGHIPEEGGPVITQKDIGNLNVLQAMAVLSGKTSTVYHRMGKHNFGVLAIAKNTKRTQRNGLSADRMTTNFVWCPQTEHGTWIARRNGRTFVTGNSKPKWARGAVGGVLFTFKSYSINYVELLSRMARSGPEGRKATLLALGMLFLMAGSGGLPFAEDLDDIVDGVMQRLGYNFSSKQAKQEFFTGILGRDGAQFVERGISGIAGVPIDVAGRMGMGNLIPGTGLLTKKQDHTRDVLELLGPAGDLAKRTFDATGKLVDGNLLGRTGALATMSPTATRNVIQAIDMANTGMYRDTTGKKVIDVDGYDVLAKSIGFQPNDVARVQSATRQVQNMIGQNKMRESEIADQWAQGLFEKDADKVLAARDALARWNEANPAAPIRIAFPQIIKRVKAMREDKVTRMAKTAPKEIRAAVRKELADTE